MLLANWKPFSVKHQDCAPHPACSGMQEIGGHSYVECTDHMNMLPASAHVFMMFSFVTWP